MKKNIWTTLIICCLAVSCQKNNLILQQNQIQINKYDHTILVGKSELFVQIVKSREEMQLGLSGKEGLKNNQGMLFVFTSKQNPNFWMKDMKFDLDLIWIADSKIVGITENVPAPSAEQNLNNKKLPIYSPPQKVDMVLEVQANWTKTNDAKIYDEIKILN